MQSVGFISSEGTRDSTKTILCSIICFCLSAATHSEPHKLAWPCVNWTLQQTRLPQVDEDGDEMMEIEEEAVEKLCIQVGLEPAGSADEKYDGEGRSIIEQGTEDTNVDMEEAIPLQAENHEIMFSSCAKPARNGSESCEEPAREKRFLSSSASKLITEESPNEMMVFRSSCIISGSEKGNSTGISATDEPSGSQNETVNCVSPSSLSVVPSEVSLVLKSPTPSVSPRISSSRKSLRTSSMLNASQKDSKDENDEISERVFLCTNCKTKTQAPKAVEKVLAGAIRREMALEEFCAKQAYEIMQLNRLVQQYKHESECNSIIGLKRDLFSHAFQLYVIVA